jgi:hypothetical protein
LPFIFSFVVHTLQPHTQPVQFCFFNLSASSILLNSSGSIHACTIILILQCYLTSNHLNFIISRAHINIHLFFLCLARVASYYLFNQWNLYTSVARENGLFRTVFDVTKFKN